MLYVLYHVYVLTRDEQSALNDLCWHWDTAYVITASEDGRVWEARCMTTGMVLVADSPHELRLAIREHYARRPRG